MHLKNNTMNRILIFLGLLLCTLASNAQNIQQVTGKVTDKIGPLAGVNILNKREPVMEP